MPDVNEAFASCFRFVTTGTPETPQSQNGLTPPANWGQGIRCTNYSWGLCSPTSGGWSSQRSDSVIVSSSNSDSTKYRANANPLTINVVGYNWQAAITNPIVQVSAYIKDASGNTVYIDPPFSGYVWGLWSGPSNQLQMPNRGTAGMVSVSPSSPLSLSLNYPACPDENGVALCQCPLITFLFAANLNGIMNQNQTNKIFLDLAIYLSLGGIQCFDDPEMEIDLGSN